MVEQLLSILRAKSKEDKNYLLKDHLKETIERAIQLRNFVNKNKSVIMYAGFNDEFFRNLIIACFLHDLGKVNWKFQLKVYGKKEKEFDIEKKRYGNENLGVLYNLFGDFREIDIKDHEVISLIYSLIFLDNTDEARKIRTAILLHHYNDFYTNRGINIRSIADDYPHLKEYTDFLLNKKEEIKKLLELMLDKITSEISDNFAKDVLEELKRKLESNDMNNLKEFKDSLERNISLTTKLKMLDISGKESGKESDKEKENLYDFFVFLGCLRRCDYSASGNVKIEATSGIDEVFRDIDSKIRERIGTNSPIWQEEILKEILKENKRKMCLVAPTGSGKTEFAILWAKNMGRKFIYTLPLRVALNDIYERFRKEKEGIKFFDEKNHLSILHSTAFIEYMKEKENGKDMDTEAKINTSKLFSYPVMLTTPDQVFLTSLNYYGSDKLLSVYPESAVVIDEIQTYNPEMAAIIIKTLKIIDELKGDILVITATLPPYFRIFFEELGIDIVDVANIDYAEVRNLKTKRHLITTIDKKMFELTEESDTSKNTSTSGNEDDKEKTDGDSNESKKKKISVSNDALSEIKKIINKHSASNVMIVVNTVSKAIALYEKLEEEKVGQSLYLLHSRLIEKEKSRRIKEMKDKMKEKSEPVVLVSTQVVEASVDLDFDILITEISTIDSQIQRWGRVYRSRSENYSSNEPNIFIFTHADKYTNYIYDKDVVEKTVEVLREAKEQGHPLDYKDERMLIEDVFKKSVDGKELKKKYEDEIEELINNLKYFTVEKRSEAQRLFRDIAGFRVVAPQLMLESESELEKRFAEYITSKKDQSWKEIVKEMKGEDESPKDLDMWQLKRILYEYSFTMPAYYFEKHRWGIISHEFKGFYVLKLTEEHIKDIKDIKKYGFDKIKSNIPVDDEMIKIY